ncbi:DUF300-domain-containing protein, partial [Tilletiaria anomala UBC 951]
MRFAMLLSLAGTHLPNGRVIVLPKRRGNDGVDLPAGAGTGRSLPAGILVACSLAAAFATCFSAYLIWKQLKNYRKPILQRYVVRLLVMVPIYSIASCISLFSLDAAFAIDLVRDLYEAFVIYCFFNLLVEYLGGERSLIILLHGRQPTPHLWPINYFLQEMDASDPFTFLALKRGVLQYVQIKPVLAVITVLCKALDVYDDGKLAINNGYTWVSFMYNISVFLSLYCLGMFWACLSEDLQAFRVTWKFICIKGVIFFSFWQGLGISILVAIGLIKQIGPVADPEYISLAVQDMLICFEMPIFALMHAFAFSHKDYLELFAHHAARLPVFYAARDSVGMFDVWTDSLTTIRGTGYGYQTFEPSEGVVHAELGRQRRYKAGLRYANGGKSKYWLPLRRSGDPAEIPGERHRSPVTRFRRYLNQKRMEREGYAPLLPEEAAEAVHPDPGDEDGEQRGVGYGSHGSAAGVQSTFEYVDTVLLPEPDDDSPACLEFEDPDEDEEKLYEKSRNLLRGGIGDWGFPTVEPRRDQKRRDGIEVHREEKRRRLESQKRRSEWRRAQEAEAYASFGSDDEANAASPSSGPGAVGTMKATTPTVKKKRWSRSRFAAYADSDVEAGDAICKHNSGSEPNGAGKGKATSSSDTAITPRESVAQPRPRNDSIKGGSASAPRIGGAVDLFVEDREAEERERIRERRRGDPALRAMKRKRIFRKQWNPT